MRIIDISRICYRGMKTAPKTMDFISISGNCFVCIEANPGSVYSCQYLIIYKACLLQSEIRVKRFFWKAVCTVWLCNLIRLISNLTVMERNDNSISFTTHAITNTSLQFKVVKSVLATTVKPNRQFDQFDKFKSLFIYFEIDCFLVQEYESIQIAYSGQIFVF